MFAKARRFVDGICEGEIVEDSRSLGSGCIAEYDRFNIHGTVSGKVIDKGIVSIVAFKGMFEW